MGYVLTEETWEILGGRPFRVQEGRWFAKNVENKLLTWRRVPRWIASGTIFRDLKGNLEWLTAADCADDNWVLCLPVNDCEPFRFDDDGEAIPYGS